MSTIRVNSITDRLGTGSPDFPNGITGIFPSGTKMLFAQSVAPIGWTKDTTHDNKALRVVSGTAGSGGTMAFTTAFSTRTPEGTIGGTTLTAAQSGLPAHSHGVTDPGHTHNIFADGDLSPDGGLALGMDDIPNTQVFNTVANAFTGISINNATAQNASQSHTHTFTGTAMDFTVQYVDVIIATQN